MNAFTLINEAVVNPMPEDVEAVIAIIRSGRKTPLATLNQALAPYRVRIEDHAMFHEYPGAGGGAAANGTVYLNPSAVFRCSDFTLRQLITHELVHSGQRLKSDPGDLDRIERNDMAKLRRLGIQKYYCKEPLEAMALARNAYDTMRGAGVDIKAALRAGTAARYSPMPLGDDHRLFDKYLYAYCAAGTAQPKVESVAPYFVALLLEALREDYPRYAEKMSQEEFEYAVRQFEKKQVPIKFWRLYMHALLRYVGEEPASWDYSKKPDGRQFRDRLGAADELALQLAVFERFMPVLKQKGWPTDAEAYLREPSRVPLLLGQLRRLRTEQETEQRQNLNIERESSVLRDDERWRIIAPQTQAAANAFAYRYGAVPGKWCVAKTGDPDRNWDLYTRWLGARFVFVYDKQAKSKWAVVRYDDERVTRMKEMRWKDEQQPLTPEQTKEIEAELARLGGWEVYDKDDKTVDLNEFRMYMGRAFKCVGRYLNAAPALYASPY